ncbi:hypothetical protein M0R45_020191 [Rubus argutus]|uniref:UDP-glycosyltransferases domain-containing protein n=1 Tax=Rubus argutus TaxID=59490 RepID=A0AAW1X911_RUBAR
MATMMGLSPMTSKSTCPSSGVAAYKRLRILSYLVAKAGYPYTCILYTILLPWVAEVASEFHLPTALVWIQPATVLTYSTITFNVYKDLIRNSDNDPSYAVELPGIPLQMKCRDLPSFILASSPYSFALPCSKNSSRRNSGKFKWTTLQKGCWASCRPFLWCDYRKPKQTESKEGTEEEKLSCREELEKIGMIVPWCSQVEVLSNPSMGCFVTHCGWNSSLESLVSGVPVVAFPQWSDQCTNAKLIEDTWKTGVRVELNEEGVVVGEELKRCMDLVIGSEEMRRNAKKWKDLAREAVSEGGSSDNNLKVFMHEIGEGSSLT